MPAGLDHDGQMSTTHTGRPRLRPQRRPGITGRDEILDAASELFTTLGYAGTSTRSIADSVGIRQASLYHYFKTKDDILCALLSQTVTPTLAFIPSLLDATPPLSATEHLHALAAFDGDQLLGGTWNLGALYLLPELNVRLIPQLEKLKPGSRIVSFSFDMEGIKPDKVVHEDGETIYKWTTPLKRETGAATRPKRDPDN